MLSAFPHLDASEFETACGGILERLQQYGHRQSDWLSAELLRLFETKYLRVTKPLPVGIRAANGVKDHDPDRQVEQELDELEQDEEFHELEDDDNEALQVFRQHQITIDYDILLSPTYQVPVLYFSISDPQYRYPPTMTTLYEHLIPPQFISQAQSAGIIGGITIQDHPATNRPAFFIHPCQTAAVMEASVGKRDITAEEYLILWIGALGKCVGLNVPLALMQRDDAVHGEVNKIQT